MTCQWCGELHGADQLCQRAQRGMTRRSFCFLFGAGVAGLALAHGLETSNWYRDYNRDLHVFRPDASMQIVDRLGHSTVATFTTKADLSVGNSIAIDYQGQRLFEGRVTQLATRRTFNLITGKVTKLVDVTALELAAHESPLPLFIGRPIVP